MKYVSRYVRNSAMKIKDPEKLLADFDLISEGNDVFTRGKYKTIGGSDKTLLRNPEKQLNGFTIAIEKLSAEPLCEFEKLSDIQRNVCRKIPDIRYGQSFCFSASCGSGKTRAAIKIIKEMKAKTLIVSARSSVNAQWGCELEMLYPDLKIATKVSKTPYSAGSVPDIFILTPQYLYKYVEAMSKNKDFFRNLQFDLVIYDEIHSLMSNKFSLVLACPFIMKMFNIIEKLPYMIGLSATLPESKTDDYKLIDTIFGTPIRTLDDIRDIPVYFMDYRDTIFNRGECDENYIVPTDKEVFHYYMDYMQREDINPTPEFKMIIINGNIDATVYCAINSAIKLKQDVLLIRANNEPSIFITHTNIPDYYYDIEEQGDPPKFTLEELKTEKFYTKCRYQDYIHLAGVVVGTYHRLKEGFNCDNIVTGICTKFIWSLPSRIQILGRIRRNSDNPELQSKRRLFMVCSGKIREDKLVPGRYWSPRVLYDLKRETKLFKMENYRRKKCVRPN